MAGLLSKLHVSSGSSEDKLREAYTDVSDAVQEHLLTDATSRNALFKIHVSLGKIVNALDEQQPARANRSVSVATTATDDKFVEDKTVTEDRTAILDHAEPVIKEEEEDDDDDDDDGDEVTAVLVDAQEDSLVDDLLSDEEDTVMRD